MLFDTGVGVPDSRMMEGLKSLNVKPEDIDCLFLTHFHGDHIGGMMKDGKVVFPKAEVYASKAEYDAWMKMPADKRAQVETTRPSASFCFWRYASRKYTPNGGHRTYTGAYRL